MLCAGVAKRDCSGQQHCVGCIGAFLIRDLGNSTGRSGTRRWKRLHGLHVRSTSIVSEQVLVGFWVVLTVFVNMAYGMKEVRLWQTTKSGVAKRWPNTNTASDSRRHGGSGGSGNHRLSAWPGCPLLGNTGYRRTSSDSPR